MGEKRLRRRTGRARWEPAPEPDSSLQAWEPYVEQQIREAMARGEFDHLSGKGRPLEGLDGPHDELWWLKAKLRREGLRVTPRSLEVRREVEKLLDRIWCSRSEAQVLRHLDAINKLIRRANATACDGPPTNLSPVDEHELLARWRRRQARTGCLDSLPDPR